MHSGQRKKPKTPPNLSDLPFSFCIQQTSYLLFHLSNLFFPLSGNHPNKNMACYVPFNSRNLDVSFFALKPTVVCIDGIVEALKHFSLCTVSLGCVHSSIFKSIHGNMIIWYGAWLKRTNDNHQILNETLLSMLANVATMATLTDHSFFDAYVGESKDGSPAAKFFTGDVICMSSVTLSPGDSNKQDVAYACLALFKDRFHKMDGARAGICFRSHNRPRVVGLYVWKSLQSCYSYVLTSDYRKTVLPYLDGFENIDIKYDVFKVVCVSGDEDLNVKMCPKRVSLENVAEKNEPLPSVQDLI